MMLSSDQTKMRAGWQKQAYSPGSKRQARLKNHWTTITPNELCPLPRFQPMNPIRETALFQLAQSGHAPSLNRLWIQHARLAFTVINYFRVPHHLVSDVLQEGIKAIPLAIMRYDVTHKSSFATYAWYWIRQAMQRFLRYQRFNVRVPADLYPDYCRLRFLLLNEVCDPSQPNQLEQFRQQNRDVYLRCLHVHSFQESVLVHQHLREVPTYTVPTASDDEKVQRTILIERLLSKLDQRSADIIRFRFGFTPNNRKITLSKIGRWYNLTRERVRQIEVNALNKLRRLLSSWLADNNIASLLEEYGTLPEFDE